LLRGHYSASSLLRTQPPPSRLRPTSRFRRLYGLPYSDDFAPGRGGLLQLLSMSLSPCCRFHPAKVNNRVSQSSVVHAAFALTYIFRLRSCKSTGAFIMTPLPPLCRKNHTQQGPFALRTLLRFIATADPSATLSSSIIFPVSPVIRSTCLRRFRAGTRRASPVAQHTLVTMPSLPSRRRSSARQSDCTEPCCLRFKPTSSTSGASDSETAPRLLSLQPGDSRPSFRWPCR